MTIPHVRRPAAPAPLIIAMLLAAPAAGAQDTLRLDALRREVLARDPRAAQTALLERQTELRLRNAATDRLPQMLLVGEATHQSDVTSVQLAVPGGGPPAPPKDRWQAVVNVEQMIYDGGAVSGRRAVERARLDESRDAVRVAQHRLLAELNASFFAAFLLQERAAEVGTLIDDLRARHAVVAARVREGSALAGEAAAIEAELLRATQARAEVLAARRAALAVLGVLRGQPVDSADTFALPDLAEEVARARAAGGADSLRGRPEFDQFASARERIDREASLAAVERRPRLYLFGQAGVGKPGLDQFRREPDEFYLAGLRMEWRFWTWGDVPRQQESLRLQQRIVETEEAAFAQSLERAVAGNLADMDRLEQALATDERIIALREQIERQARAQLDEGAITAAEYVEARGDVLDSRLERQRHRVELAQARAAYLTTLGMTGR